MISIVFIVEVYIFCGGMFMQKFIIKIVALTLATMLIFSANSRTISGMASELIGGGYSSKEQC